MKKILSTQILFIFILFISMGCGCKKDPVEPDYPMEITTQTLNGKWNFVSLYDEWSSTTYTDCNYILNNMATWYGKVFLEYDFNSTTEKVTITDKCTGIPPNINLVDVNYSVIGTDIVLEGSNFYPFTYTPETGELVIQIPPPDTDPAHLYVTIKIQ